MKRQRESKSPTGRLLLIENDDGTFIVEADDVGGIVQVTLSRAEARRFARFILKR